MPIEFFSYAHSEYGALYRRSNNTFFEVGPLLYPYPGIDILIVL